MGISYKAAPCLLSPCRRGLFLTSEMADPNGSVNDRVALLEKRTEAAEAAVTSLEYQVAAMEVDKSNLIKFKEETLSDLKIVASELAAHGEPESGAPSPAGCNQELT